MTELNQPSSVAPALLCAMIDVFSDDPRKISRLREMYIIHRRQLYRQKYEFADELIKSKLRIDFSEDLSND